MLRRLHDGSYVKYASDLQPGDVMRLPGVGTLAIEQAVTRDALVHLVCCGHPIIRSAGQLVEVVLAPDLIEALLVLDAVRRAVDTGRLGEALIEVGKLAAEYRRTGVLP